MELFESSLIKDKAAFYLNTERKPGLHFREELELHYLLSGSVSYHTAKSVTELAADDFILTNPFEFHSFSADGQANILTLRISNSLYQAEDAAGGIDCCSRRCSDTAANALRAQLAELLIIQGRDTHLSTYGIYSRIYGLLNLIRTSFPKVTIPQRRSSALLQTAIQYIHAHLEEELSLTELAASLYVTPNYITKLFRQELGIRFTEYVTMLRLERARQLLRSTGLTVTEIAMTCGFPSVKSIISAFKAHTGMTPAQFRNAAQAEPSAAVTPSVDEASLFNGLLRYLVLPETEPEVPASIPDAELITVNPQVRGRKYTPIWNHIISMGSAKELLLASVQEQLREAQEMIGFTWLHAHGLLDDAMHIYSEDVDGTPIYTFSYLDTMLDFIKSIDMYPYLEFSYTPLLLARDVKFRFNLASSVASYPNSMERWCELVEQIVRHCIARYGLDEVLHWRFSMTGLNYTFFEPCNIGREEYFYWSECTWRTLKRIDSRLRFGGPTTEGTSVLFAESDSFQSYFQYCIDHSCVPDFCAVHYYPHNFEKTESDFTRLFQQQTMSPIDLLEDPDALQHIAERVTEILSVLGLSHLEIVVDKWNSTVWQHDLCNDTAYKGAFIAKHAVQQLDGISMMGYGLYSDFIEELPPRETFYGGHGLVTYNGLKKPGFWVMHLLKSLSGRILRQSEGCLILRDGAVFQIVLYHYCHYSSMYRHSYISEENRRDRYSTFQEQSEKVFTILLDPIPAVSYTMQKWQVNRAHGSVYDRWMEIGAPEQMDAEVLNWLNLASAPSLQEETIPANNGKLQYTTILQPHEVQLIRLTPQEDTGVYS